MSYKGKYTVKNPEKYIGDVNDVIFRSLWERQVMKWFDFNPSIIQWNSEEVVIPYICETDNRPHRYFIDFFFMNTKGEKFIIEVKPDKQTRLPTTPKKTASGRTSRRYLNESFKYIKNQSKWKAAEHFAEKNGMIFQVWTEHTLKSLGIKLSKK